MDEGTYGRAEEYIRGLFEGDSGGHDFYHSMRVHDLALRICREEGGDEAVVRLAALLHDADDPKLFGTEGLANARGFMEAEAVPEETREAVCRAISQVSFKGTDTRAPDTLEGMIVQDADRLDAMGAIGIARAFAYGGSRGRAMHVPGEAPREGMTEAEYRANRGTTVNHFHEKLLRLRGMMNTVTARRMADARHDYMVAFLDEFMAEWDGARRSQQPEAVLRELQYPVVPHAGQLGGQGAPVHAQVLRHLPPVHGYRELGAPGRPRLVGEVRPDLVPGAPLGHLVEPPPELQGLMCQNLDEVAYHPRVELAGRGARGGYPADVEEHDLGLPDGHRAGVHAGAGGAGVLRADDPAAAVGRQEVRVPPPVLLDHVDPPAEDDAEGVGAVAAAEEVLAGHVAVAPRAHAPAHRRYLPVRGPGEEPGVAQNSSR